jgi:hypothetical protein
MSDVDTIASTVMEEGSNDATLADRVVEGRESLASNEFVNSDSDAAREGFWRALGDSSSNPIVYIGSLKRPASVYR